MVHMMNMDVIEGKWSSWGCKVSVHFHLSEPLFSPLSCPATCWTEISLQFSLETTLMSHTDLAHQYFTSKPNLLRMTTYHRQDMSFTVATFTSSVFSICTHPHIHVHIHTDMHILWWYISSAATCDGVVLPTNTLIIPLKSVNHILYCPWATTFRITMKM